jgi:hypothetical protein
VSTVQASVYAPAFLPPRDRLEEIHPDNMEERVTYRVDGVRLAVQYAALACLTGGLLLLAGRRS